MQERSLIDRPLLKKVRDYDDARKVKQSGLYPYFRPVSSAQNTEVVMNGEKVLMLGSNSYLGLTTHPDIRKAVKAAVDKYGSGCARSRFLNGTLDIHLELEEELADLVGKEAVALYSTGFQVNLGVISCLVGRDDYIITDKSDHASIVDGCLLSFGDLLRYTHNDMESLDDRLSQLDPDDGKMIVVDGVFSMEGDIAPLPRIVELAEQHNAVVMVDDAHAIGVLGEEGSGTSNHFGLTDRVHLIMGTFSKSLASLGGFIAADKQTIEYLRHNSRSLIFSASMSPANTAAVLAALKIMRNEPERLEKLWDNTGMMREGLEDLGYDLGESETPILPVYLGDGDVCLKMCKLLEQAGIFVNPVVPPAVPPNSSLLRISLMATHTESQIRRAIETMGQVGRKLGVV
ncbi:MAG: aminotransferase class I/II-fold pyridoxal phosphate-dependent enzyme [Planctomycetota bacterium]